MTEEKYVDPLIAQNRKLRRALSGLLCWCGMNPEGPAWATPEAKKRNREMYETAYQAARECFPEQYISSAEDEPLPSTLN